VWIFRSFCGRAKEVYCVIWDLTVVTMWTVVFWVVTSCCLVGGYQPFGAICRLHLHLHSLLLWRWRQHVPQNLSNHPQDYAPSQPTNTNSYLMTGNMKNELTLEMTLMPQWREGKIGAVNKRECLHYWRELVPRIWSSERELRPEYLPVRLAHRVTNKQRNGWLVLYFTTLFH
jgi:hypothetical protein